MADDEETPMPDQTPHPELDMVLVARDDLDALYGAAEIDLLSRTQVDRITAALNDTHSLDMRERLQMVLTDKEMATLRSGFEIAVPALLREWQAVLDALRPAKS